MIDFDNPTQVAALKFAVMWGYVPKADFISSIDNVIIKHEDPPPSILCELSVCKFDHEIYSILDKLSEEHNRIETLKFFLRKYVRDKVGSADDIYHLAGCISGHTAWEDPAPFSKMKALFHELQDAKIGVYGDYNTLCADYQKLIMQVKGS